MEAIEVLMESDDSFPMDLIDESIINESGLTERFQDLRIEKFFSLHCLGQP